MRALAIERMGGERPDHTLQPTALVHEAYARLVDAEVAYNDRVHFFAVAAQMMRRILVDHARTRGRKKRGGGAVAVTLDERLVTDEPVDYELVELDAALDRLAEHEPRMAKVVELHFFGGLTYPETATALGVSESTVNRDLRMAKAWLAAELEEGTEP